MTWEIELESAQIRNGVDKAEAEVAKCEAALAKQEAALAQLEAELTAKELELAKGPVENTVGWEDARMAQIQLEVLGSEGDLAQRKQDLVLEKYRLLCLRSFVAERRQEAAQKDIETAQHAMGGWEEERPEPDEILAAKRKELAREGQLDLLAEAELMALQFPMWEDWAEWDLERKARMALQKRLPELQAIYETAKLKNAQANDAFHHFFSQVVQAVKQATNYEIVLLLMQKTGVPAETAVQALGLSAKDAQPILACLERTRRTVRHLSSSPNP